MLEEMLGGHGEQLNRSQPTLDIHVFFESLMRLSVNYLYSIAEKVSHRFDSKRSN